VELAYPLGLNRRFVYFAILSSVSSVVLVATIIVASSLFGNLLLSQGFEVRPGSGVITEAVAMFFITIAIGLVMAVTALPLSLPSSGIVWFASLNFFAGKVTEKWRIRFAASVSGLAGALGFLFWLNWLDSLGGATFPFILVLVPAVMLAATASAELIYRPATKVAS
jgi:hypothetical protein